MLTMLLWTYVLVNNSEHMSTRTPQIAIVARLRAHLSEQTNSIDPLFKTNR